MYTIYCHIFPNNKRYIGITKTDVYSRWSNGSGYKTCPLVDRAIQKYGWNNVEHVILSTVNTKEEAEDAERRFIKEFDTTDPTHGYNILPGGDVATNEPTDEMRHKLGNGWRGKQRSNEDKAKIAAGVKKKFEREESNGHFGMKHSDQTRQKMSESQKKRWYDEELRKSAREKMIKRMADEEYKKRILDNLAKCNKISPPKKVLSESGRKKISETHKGRWLGEKSPTSRPVLQFTKQGEFIKRWANAGEAERSGIALRGNISKCCNHTPHCLTAGGYKWEFE